MKGLCPFVWYGLTLLGMFWCTEVGRGQRDAQADMTTDCIFAIGSVAFTNKTIGKNMSYFQNSEITIIPMDLVYRLNEATSNIPRRGNISGGYWEQNA